MWILRTAATAALWLLALVGVACGLVWVATATGFIKPLVVVSGSMEPEIMTGDLLVDVPVATIDLRPGDVVSLESGLTEHLVTHRIVSIEETRDGAFLIEMKGDANEFGDALDYVAGDTVWKPAVQLAGWGGFAMRLATPAVALPLVVGLVSLLGVSLLAPPRTRADRSTGPVPAPSPALI